MVNGGKLKGSFVSLETGWYCARDGAAKDCAAATRIANRGPRILNIIKAAQLKSWPVFEGRVVSCLRK